MSNQNIMNVENSTNKISVEQFINEFNAIKLADKKGDYIAKHIIVDYINYEDKIAMCSRIVNSSMYMEVEINGGKERIFRQNTPTRMMNHIIAMIDAYTDIEIRFGKGVLEDFNALEKEGLTDLIIGFIPEAEVERISQILDMKIDDLYENERSVGKVCDSVMSGINMFSNTFNKSFESAMNDFKNNPETILELLGK